MKQAFASTRGWAVLATMIISAFLTAVPVSRAGAISNGAFSLEPVAGSFGTAARSVLQYQVNPGETIRDAVVLSNLTSVSQVYAVYSADAYNVVPGGEFALRAANAPRADVGAWTHLGFLLKTVAAHTSVTLPFSLTAPLDATPGDHAGGIVALNLSGIPAQKGHIHVLIRQGVGVRVYVRVQGPIRPSMVVTNLRVNVSSSQLSFLTGSSKANVRFVVVNTGNTVLNGRAEVSAVDSLGRTVKRFTPIPIDVLLPGGRATVVEPTWRSLPLIGPYVHVRVTVLAGGLKASAQTQFVEIPVVLVILPVVVLVVLALLACLGRRRRKLRHRGQPSFAKAPEQSGASEVVPQLS